MALFMEQTKSADAAAKYGLLHARVSIEPKTIKTYFGDLEIVEAWFERRPHPEVLKKALELGENKREHFTKDHLLLCIRHRRLKVEEATQGGVWFTSDEEWMGFSMADREVRRFRFWSGEPTQVALTLARIHDLDLSGKKPKPTRGQGIAQILRLEKVEPNSSSDATPPDLKNAAD
jgi:hypothetical protein